MGARTKLSSKNIDPFTGYNDSKLSEGMSRTVQVSSCPRQRILSHYTSHEMFNLLNQVASYHWIPRFATYDISFRTVNVRAAT